MAYLKIKEFSKEEFFPSLQFTIKWLLIATVVGLLAGSASAGFLVSLHWVTEYREANIWIIALFSFANSALAFRSKAFSSKLGSPSGKCWPPKEK